MSVYFYGCMTLDGYLADKNHSLAWLDQTGDVEETGYSDFYKRMDITIMGRRTFSAIEKLENIEAIYPSTRNYVFTHSKDPLPKGFIPQRGDVAAFVKQAGKGENIWIIGGNTMLSPLLDGNMIDCLILQTAPVLLGEGIPLFTQKEALKRFLLQDVKKYGQFAELIYTKILPI